jgi:hypothetical protein
MHRSIFSGRRAAATVALGAAALLGLASGAGAVPLTADDLSGGCTDPAGVTVVVDLTDLGGQVEVGCAEDAATGAEALVAAGFTDTRDASGLICAIESLPDPCPETFEGSFWSYWYATPDGDWQSYLEGPDTAVPDAGSLEGWRYSDGTSGPTVTPAVVTDAATDAVTDESDDAAETTEADGEVVADQVVADQVDTSASTADGLLADVPPWAAVVIGLAVLGALVAAGVGLARRSRDGGHGPAGQD